MGELWSHATKIISISFMTLQNLIEAVKTSIELAEQGKSKLTNDILEMEGMSGYKNRHFLNNILNREGARYLEIGTWKGSTHISALYQNNPEFSIAIDDFSQFDGPKQDFESNCQKFLGKSPNFVNGDCFLINPLDYGISNINVYFYDGEHSPNNQRRALEDFYPYMANEFIYIVDDWNWGTVQHGGNEGIRNTGVEVVYKQEIFTDNHAGDRNGWWNGWYIGVLKKKS